MIILIINYKPLFLEGILVELSGFSGNELNTISITIINFSFKPENMIYHGYKIVIIKDHLNIVEKEGKKM